MPLLPSKACVKTRIFYVPKRCGLNCTMKSGLTAGCQLRFYELCPWMNEQVLSNPLGSPHGISNPSHPIFAS